MSPLILTFGAFSIHRVYDLANRYSEKLRHLLKPSEVHSVLAVAPVRHSPLPHSKRFTKALLREAFFYYKVLKRSSITYTAAGL